MEIALVLGGAVLLLIVGGGVAMKKWGAAKASAEKDQAEAQLKGAKRAQKIKQSPVPTEPGAARDLMDDR